MSDLTLFDLDEAARWVVEVDEIRLNSIDSPGAAWWAVHQDRPGLAAGTIYLAIAPPGGLLYLRCDDREQADWLRGFLVENGCHPKAVTVRELGRSITCAGCGERRPFWATARRMGQRCRLCWVKHFSFVESTGNGCAGQFGIRRAGR